jgi:hypothetical protein
MPSGVSEKLLNGDSAPSLSAVLSRLLFAPLIALAADMSTRAILTDASLEEAGYLQRKPHLVS